MLDRNVQSVLIMYPQLRRNEMIRECCACGLILGHKKPYKDTRVTSGLCDECRDRLYPQLKGGVNVQADKTRRA